MLFAGWPCKYPPSRPQKSSLKLQIRNGNTTGLMHRPPRTIPGADTGAECVSQFSCSPRRLVAPKLHEGGSKVETGEGFVPNGWK
jgi:hypothetical protein